MNQKPIEDRVRDYRWPEISPDVRLRVMAVPLAAAEPITWSDRVWFSRGWRLAAVAAAVVLLSLDQFSGAGQPSSLSPTPRAMAEAQAIEELAQQAGLSQMAAASLARRSLFDASRARPLQPPGPTALQTLALETPGGM